MGTNAEVRQAGVAGVHEVAGYRVLADRVQLWGAVVGFVLCSVQVAFAAYGFWQVVAAQGDEAAGAAAFEPHLDAGMALSYLAILLLILGIVARSGWKGWGIPLVLTLLLFGVQGFLAGLGFDVSSWYGALHAFDGMIITAGFVWLAYDRARHPLAHKVG